MDLRKIESIFTGEMMPKKRRLGPQNGSGSSGPEKTAKKSKFCCNLKTERTDDGGSNGIGGWPPISTWIIKAPKWLRDCRT